MNQISIYDLKTAVHNFLGQLSIEELTQNDNLVREVERLFQMFEVAQGL